MQDSKQQTIEDYERQAEDCLGRAWDPTISPESRMVFVEMAKCYTELVKSRVEMWRIRDARERGVEWTTR